MSAADESETERPRDASTGRWMRTLASAERDAAAAGLKADGRTYQQIADELGFCDRGEAWRAVQRALVATVRDSAERLRQVEAAKLDELYVEALDVLGRDHVTVSYGEIVKGDDGMPLLDDGPKLQAIDRLLKVRESYRKLFGLDAATKTEVSGGVRYEIVGVDPSEMT